jgi:hypothetical protein
MTFGRFAATVVVNVAMARGIYAFLPDRIAYGHEGGITTIGMIITVMIMAATIPVFVKDWSRDL